MQFCAAEAYGSLTSATNTRSFRSATVYPLVIGKGSEEQECVCRLNNVDVSLSPIVRTASDGSSGVQGKTGVPRDAVSPASREQCEGEEGAFEGRLDSSSS